MDKKDLKHPAEEPSEPKVFDKPIPEIKGDAQNDVNPTSSAYPVFDNDLAGDNLQNDVPQADLRDI